MSYSARGPPRSGRFSAKRIRTPETRQISAVGRCSSTCSASSCRLGARQPTLLVFEDMHWADPSTRDLVAFLGRNLRDAAIALVLAYRTDELHRRHPLRSLITDLERDPQFERIALSWLTRWSWSACSARSPTSHPRPMCLMP